MSEQVVRPFRYMPPPTVTDPYATARTQPFWDAARQERLTAPRCAPCGRFRMPPSTFCPGCLSRQLVWEPLPGTGTVYTYIVVRHPLNPTASEYVPYIPAVVEADGAPGMRFVTNVVDCEPEDVTVGMPVRVVWNHVDETLTLPYWAPA